MALQDLSPQELLEVRQSLEQELRNLQQNGVALQQTASKFGAAGQAIEYLQEQKQGVGNALRAHQVPDLDCCDDDDRPSGSARARPTAPTRPAPPRPCLPLLACSAPLQASRCCCPSQSLCTFRAP